MEPDDVDGNEEVEDDDDDAVRGGGVAAIMEQKMSGNQRRDAGRLERERERERSPTVRRNEGSFGSWKKLQYSESGSAEIGEQ